MIFLTTLSILLVTVYGRPESSGYQYDSTPSLLNSYTAPLASVGSLRSISLNRTQEEGLNSLNIPSSAKTSSSSEGTSTSKYYNSGSFSSSEDSSSDDSDGFGSSENVIEKEIYINLPSPELEQELQPMVGVRVPPPQTRYKIIFVKAPSVSAAVPMIPPLPQNEEKTIVYVLMNKQEQQEIVIPTPEPTEPSKPEVYFIKYKAQTDEPIKDEGTSGSLRQSEISAKYGPLKTF